jgi:hypothetical protein
MPSNKKVSLQINLAPGDYLHATEILPHQLNALSNQVDEIILIVDTKPSKGRFALNWNENKDLLDVFLEIISKDYAVKIIPVDYRSVFKSQVAQYFFGKNYMPDKDFRGGPFYAYFFGLYMATNNYVFHLDSDIFLGGGSETWVSEAVDILEDKHCLIVSPLPGPPHPQEMLIEQRIISKLSPYAFELAGMSTRLFMVDKSKFESKKLSIKKPALRSQIKAIIQGNPNAQLPELLIADYMYLNNLKRVDFLGTHPGLWSLHPPYRTKTFYEGLPQLIKSIEENSLPATQYGFYDIVDEVCDWTDARERLKTNRWWKGKS